MNVARKKIRTHTREITYRGETVEERLKRGVKRYELNRARMQNEGRRGRRFVDRSGVGAARGGRAEKEP